MLSLNGFVASGFVKICVAIYVEVEILRFAKYDILLEFVIARIATRFVAIPLNCYKLAIFRHCELTK